jgi:hypothetical protein
MTEIIINGQPTPSHFGMKAVDEFTKRTGGEFEDNVTSTDAIGNIESIVALTTVALNEGARRSGADKRYTEDDVWDIFDDDPALILRVSEIFVESIIPLTERLGNLAKTDDKPRAKSGLHELGRGAKEEGARSDPNAMAAARR